MQADAERKPDYVLKIVVLGDNCCWCRSRSFNTFTIENYSFDDQLAFIGVDFRGRRLTLDSKLVEVKVWYPTWGERFRYISPFLYRGANGFAVVFDYAEPNTLKNLDDWIQEIESSGPPNTEKLFIGGFCDNTKTKGVSLSEVEEFATARSIPLVELNKDTLEKVDESFQTMIRTIIKKLRPNDSSEEPTCGKKTTCSFL